MKTEKTFPRNFCSSSAAYRAIYQYEDKNKMERGTSGLVMTKIDAKNFLVSKEVKITIDEFPTAKPKVSYDDVIYRYFEDGLKKSGYYELKTGERRRPNSKYLPTETVYSDFIEEVCQ